MLTKRAFLTGLIAAPVIARAEWLMPVKKCIAIDNLYPYQIDMINMLTRKVLRNWKNSTYFINNVDKIWSPSIGASIKIRLPNDHT